MNVQPFLFGDGWVEVKDGNDTGRAIFDRHYSRFRDGAPRRRSLLYLGPGEKLVLVTACARALFAWRKFLDDSGQTGVNCAIFRNEGAGLSSNLIRAADEIAWARWPGERHYTYVNPADLPGTNPGYCFLVAGWRRCGYTKKRHLLILERLPDGQSSGETEAATEARPAVRGPGLAGNAPRDVAARQDQAVP